MCLVASGVVNGVYIGIYCLKIKPTKLSVE